MEARNATYLISVTGINWTKSFAPPNRISDLLILNCQSTKRKGEIREQMYLMFFKELRCQCPGCISDDLIHITTVSEGFISLSFIHHSEAFEFMS